jgi:hypothetical protein
MKKVFTLLLLVLVMFLTSTSLQPSPQAGSYPPNSMLEPGQLSGFMLDKANPADKTGVSTIATERMVTDKERGLFFGKPDGEDWSKIGIYLGLPVYLENFRAMDPEAIKISFGRFQHFSPADNTQDGYFPYDRLKAYEAQEVAAGRPPIFVTATYQGQSRPVYFEWQLVLDQNNRPTAPSNIWFEAVNVADERFIRFWLNEYARKVLLNAHINNTWVGLDNCAFRYDLYGVLNNNNHYVAGVSWDKPFAQSEREFLDSIGYFFRRVKELAPDIHLICNEGDLNDSNTFPQLYANVDGVAEEDMQYVYKPSEWYRAELFRKYTILTWAGSVGKVGLITFHYFNSDSSLEDNLRTAYVHYLIVRGVNFFFAPQLGVPEVPPANYEPMQSALGMPVTPSTTVQEPNAAEGYRLYSRETEGGLVYLNWTGTTKTITLPPGRTYYNRAGEVVTWLTLPDMTGDYVLFTPGQRVPKPLISSRGEKGISGIATVKLETSLTSTTIYYTLDGSDPTTSSQVYTGPITLTQSATLKAKAVRSGYLDSFVNSASFDLIDWLLVTNPNEDGKGTVAGTLSYALTYAKSGQIIKFALANASTRLKVRGKLPTVPAGVTLDGGSCSNPIILDGENLTGDTFGLELGGQNLLQNLVIYHLDGLVIPAAQGNNSLKCVSVR